jgi:dTDP-4-amino-4,6-dideoxygalactose transaminase
LSRSEHIPLVDLAWQHAQIEEQIREGWDQVLADTSFILGKPVDQFEDAFARFSGVEYCVGVANGTDALELALRAIGVEAGDEVILPANTFIATALAVSRVGATPTLVDCDPATFVLTPESVEPSLTSRTKAIIPVHLFGQMAPIQEIRAAYPEMWIVEDGAQSQGATRHGEGSGSVGHVGATSFYPGKNIGAYGDAGAVLTNDEDIYREVRALRNWGSDEKYLHPIKGFNSRLDTLQAVVLSAKLAHLSDWNGARSVAASRYDELLADLPLVLPVTAPANTHVWHLYVVLVDQRDAVLQKLHSQGVGAGVHYPIPIHLQGAYRDLGHRSGDFPVAENLANRVLSLPMHPGIRPEDQEKIAGVLGAALRGHN